MSETNAQEPTMEEILASIRRIISEDDAPAAPVEGRSSPEASLPAAALPPGPKAAPPPVADPEPEPEDDDVLELTELAPPADPPPAATQLEPELEPEPEPEPEPYRAPPPSSFRPLGDLDFSAPPPPVQTPPPPPPQPQHEDEPLVAPHAAESAALHFGQLAQSLSMPASDRTLEDVVRDLLRPLLKDWLDRHLSKIVEARVQAEVERISRGRGY